MEPVRLKKDALKDLKAEAAAMQSAAAPLPPKQETLPPVSDNEQLNLVPIIGPAVSVVSFAVTTRYNVAPLVEAELQKLAEAIANVAKAYNLRVSDPKVAAWYALGAAFGSVAYPRIVSALSAVKQPEREPEPEKPGEPIAA